MICPQFGYKDNNKRRQYKKNTPKKSIISYWCHILLIISCKDIKNVEIRQIILEKMSKSDKSEPYRWSHGSLWPALVESADKRICSFIKNHSIWCALFPQYPVLGVVLYNFLLNFTVYYGIIVILQHFFCKFAEI